MYEYISDPFNLLITQIFQIQAPNTITLFLAYFILFLSIGKLSIIFLNLYENRNKKLDELEASEKLIVLVILGLFAYGIGVSFVNLFNGITSVTIRTLIT